MAGLHRTGLCGDLAGGWIDLIDGCAELHAFDAEIAKPGPGDGETEPRWITQEFHEALGGEDAEALADGVMLPRPPRFSKVSENCIAV